MAITDKITKVSNGTRAVPTTLTATRAVGATSISCGALTGWQSTYPTHFIMYDVNTAGQKVAGSQIDAKGIVSGTTITNIQYKAGSDVGHAVGAVVEAAPTAAYADDLAEGILAHADPDGTLKAGAVDSAAVLASDVVTTAKILDANVTTAKLADGAVTSAKVATGIPVQVVSVAYAAVGTTSTTIPADDTIPQNTEGAEFMTLTITPKSATNILAIEVVTMSSTSIVTNAVVALFQDSTANALAATTTTVPGNTYTTMIPLGHTMTAGTTSATTFKVRCGPSAAATYTFNGTAGGRLFGAITKSYIKITEYKA